MEKALAYRILTCWWKLMEYPLAELPRKDSSYLGNLEEEVQNLEAALEIMDRNKQRAMERFK